MTRKARAFFGHYKTFSYERGQILFRPGDPVANIHFLLTGMVRQYVVLSSGEEITIHFYRPGSFFPIVLALARVANRFYFETVSAVTAKKAPSRDVLKFVTGDGEVLLDLTKRLSKAIDGLSMRIEHGLSLRAGERVERLLSYLTEKFEGKRITHREMANFLGVSRETVSREMSRLKAKR